MKPKPKNPNSANDAAHDPSLSAAAQPDDGIDPRYDQRGAPPAPNIDRKAAQLCAQVRRALEFAIPEALQDTEFDAMVVDVQPAPNTSHMLVLLSSLTPLDEATSQQLELTLMQYSGQLRTAVAHSIQRRKAPTLSFRVIP